MIIMVVIHNKTEKHVIYDEAILPNDYIMSFRCKDLKLMSLLICYFGRHHVVMQFKLEPGRF